MKTPHVETPASPTRCFGETPEAYAARMTDNAGEETDASAARRFLPRTFIVDAPGRTRAYPLRVLRHHVTGAIERREATPIEEVPFIIRDRGTA